MPRLLLLATVILMSDDSSAPDFDDLWDYSNPAATETRFRALLPQAEAAGRSYRAQLLTQIARTQGLQRQFEQAHATLDEAQRMIDDTMPLPRTRYLLERGRVFNSAGLAERAGPLFEQAWSLATEQGLDFHAIDAAHMLAIVEQDSTRALAWNLRALERAERSSEPRARRWQASLYNNIGWTRFEQRAYDKAMEVFQKAVTLRQEAGQQRELRIARYCVAKTLRHMERFDEALAIGRQLLREWELSGEPDGYVFEELAECLLALGRSEEARPHFRRAHELLSRDVWLAQHEPERLARLKQLGE